MYMTTAKTFTIKASDKTGLTLADLRAALADLADMDGSTPIKGRVRLNGVVSQLTVEQES